MQNPFTPAISRLLDECPLEMDLRDMLADACGGPQIFAVIAMEHWTAALQDYGVYSCSNLKAHLILESTA